MRSKPVLFRREIDAVRLLFLFPLQVGWKFSWNGEGPIIPVSTALDVHRKNYRLSYILAKAMFQANITWLKAERKNRNSILREDCFRKDIAAVQGWSLLLHTHGAKDRGGHHQSHRHLEILSATLR